MKRHRLKAALGVALTIALLAWVLRDVSFAEVWREVGDSDPWLMAGAVVLATFSFVLRAVRWRVLLLPGHPDSTFGSRFGAVCVGFMANNLLPARLGEFARAFALTRVEPIRLSPSLASLVAERIFDGLVLAFFLFAAMMAPGFPLGNGELIRRTAVIGATVFAAGFVVLWLVARHPRPALRLFEHTIGRVLTPRLTDRAIEILGSFLEGLGALHRPGVFVRALGWTLVVWLNLAASVWLGLLAFGVRAPGFVGAVFLQAVIAFAVAAPSSPGFFGVFEAASRIGLELWEVPATTIVSFATSYHILTFIPVTLLGLWYVRRFGLEWAEMGRGEELVEQRLEAEAERAGRPGTGSQVPGSGRRKDVDGPGGPGPGVDRGADW